MMKRMLAFLCVLALLMGMYVVPASAAETNAAEGGFYVGYAKEDINPWMTNSSVYGVSGVPLPTGMTTSDAAYTNYTVSLSGTYVYRPSNNSYFRTARTMIKVPMAGYANSTERLSTGIQDDNGDGYIGYGDGVFITCTTVTDANGYTLFLFTSDTISGYSNLQKDVAKEIAKKISGVSTNQVTLTGSHSHGGPDFNTLRSAKVNRTNALWAAYYDYVVDKMVGAAVSAYNGRQEATMSRGGIDASDSSGYQLNKIRQYVTTQYKNNKATGVEFISGAHLNTYTDAGKAINGYTYTKENITDADDTLYILQFATEGQKPIILVNWRAHATTTSANANLGLTSDYVNSFRYAMEQAGYRVAFFQGAAGNIVTNSSPWVTEQNISSDLEEAVYYGGTLLAGVALDCLSGDNMQVQTGNTIRATHVDMPTQLPSYSEGLIAAANNYIKNGHSGYHPKPYRHTDGKFYYINSKQHANAITSTGTAKTLNLSTFMLGDGVAILTSPNEMYDRYSLEVDTLAEARAATDNDWYDLKTDAYGMPFVFGYTNGHSSYLGDYLSYSYNEDFVYPDTYSNGTIDGTYGVGIGSYETNTSRYARGTGEAVVAMYGEMLFGKTAICEHCGGKAVKWTALTAGKANADTLEAGHYYLYEDITYAEAKEITGKVCLDLNGHTITTTNRAFTCTQSGTEFSLMDSSVNQTGKVISYTNNESAGGVIYAYNTTSSNSVIFNLYGGTLELASEDGAGNLVEKGGVVCLYGTMNMYGGTIEGGNIREVSQGKKKTSTGCGGTIFAYENSVLNVYSGEIKSGSIPGDILDREGAPYTPKGKGVYLNSSTSRINLSGDAIVGEIYVNATNNENVTIGRAAANGSQAEAFTGIAKLAFNTSKISVTESGVDIGTVNGTLPSTLTCTNESYQLQSQSGNLIVYESKDVARIGDTDYEDVSSAIDAYTGATGSYIQLLKPVDTIDIGEKTVYLDLNGYDVANVEGTGTLYCMDSETDDYQVDAANHTGYGKITGTVGENVKAVPAEAACAEDGYLMVTEDGIGISFHRVNLRLTHITLRTQSEDGAIEPGVYYKSAFATDAVATKLIDTFGVALSVKAKPAADNLETDCEYSRFSGSELRAGENNTAITSTLLNGVMKESNLDSENKYNANLPVNGCPYIKLTNGQYMFGSTSAWSLRQLVEGKMDEATGNYYNGVNDIWDSGLSAEQKNAVMAIYRVYKSVMEDWQISNIQNACQEEA